MGKSEKEKRTVSLPKDLSVEVDKYLAGQRPRKELSQFTAEALEEQLRREQAKGQDSR